MIEKNEYEKLKRKRHERDLKGYMSVWNGLGKKRIQNTERRSTTRSAGTSYGSYLMDDSREYNNPNEDYLTGSTPWTEFNDSDYD